MLTKDLIQEIVTKAVQYVPVSIREVEAVLFLQALRKAALLMGASECPSTWAETILRRMGEQFTVFQGQAGPTRPEKRKR